ncbi:MAG: hypothetical protein K8Q91_00360 [Candidatus Vogelbacteria bacterium]|nr:hypothetical protein [Candidatus Vogelbacteria bacterium]
MPKEKYNVIFFPPAGKGQPEVYQLEGCFNSKTEAEEAVRDQYPVESSSSDERCESWVVCTEAQMANARDVFF